MLIKKPTDVRPSEITSREHYVTRRKFMQAATAAGSSLVAGEALPAVIPSERRAKFDGVVASEYSTGEKQNSYTDATTYNNYFEFGTRKEDPLSLIHISEPTRRYAISCAGVWV